MNIPLPKLYPVIPDMHGLNEMQQLKYNLEHSPMFDLAEDWVVDFDFGIPVVFPAKFRTDMASIPRALQITIPADGPLGVMAIFHDFFYGHGYLLTYVCEESEYSQTQLDMKAKFPAGYENLMPVFIGHDQNFADKLLRDGTVFLTGATVQAKAAYDALTIFGHEAWNKYRKFGPNIYNMDTLGLPGVMTI